MMRATLSEQRRAVEVAATVIRSNAGHISLSKDEILEVTDALEDAGRTIAALERKQIGSAHSGAVA